MARRARRAAARAALERCPRCGAAREQEQRFCLECGLALPALEGRLPALRRRWLERVGWYPGDFVWVALAAGLLAAAGAGGALALHRWRAPGDQALLVVPAPTIPGRPAPGAGSGGALRWPAGEPGWTVVLASLPASGGRRAPDALAASAAAAGLPEVGVLDSAGFASLQPGYYVVFSGVYGASDDAQSALRSVQARGYAGAYASPITP